MHSIGMDVGDLNGCNIMFDLYENVYFIDLDGMGIDDVFLFLTDDFKDPMLDKI